MNFMLMQISTILYQNDFQMLSQPTDVFYEESE